ncbi:MAG: hypothetical protein MSG64_16105 [Pyrinomonadaceae bacterium MAG19_C2-C3]|nr:hypothetical protein [Pyrinomonadaceae bacterium MAG19_C2-C3]
MESEYKRTTGENRDMTETPDVSGVSNPDVSHEINDVNVRAITKFVIGLVAATALVFVLMAATLAVFERLEARNDPDPSAMTRQGEQRLPPYPRLQAAQGDRFAPEDLTNDPDLARRIREGEIGEGNSEMRFLPDQIDEQGMLNFELKDAPTEWMTLREIRREEMSTYGRVQGSPDTFRIPIDEAKRLMLEGNRLQSRPMTPEQSQANGYDLPPTMQSSATRAERRRQ